MKIYIVQVNEHVSSVGYKKFNDAFMFMIQRIQNAQDDGFKLEHQNNSWHAKMVKGKLVEEYKILEIFVNE